MTEQKAGATRPITVAAAVDAINNAVVRLGKATPLDGDPSGNNIILALGDIRRCLLTGMFDGAALVDD